MNKTNDNENAKVSVIIPAFNSELYLPQCINSVLSQTYKNYEIIIINDGSSDNTLNIAKKFEKENDCIKVINHEKNKGQGFCRNYALNISSGDYILFLDSDDFIEPVTLEVAIERIIEENSDLVVFDWKYYKDINESFSYVNKNKIFRNKFLIGKECLELLSIKHYFCVNKLYAKKFLVGNNIKYGEGYIYEDIEFWTKVSICARKVSLIHSPLYNIRISTKSTTKTNYDTDFHYKSYIKAVTRNINIIADSNEEQYFYLYRYLIKKFWIYYKNRTPRKYRKEFIKSFVNEMSNIELINKRIPNKLMRYFYKYRVFEKRRIKLFKLIYLSYKEKRKLRRITKKIKKGINNIISWTFKSNKDMNKKYSQKLEEENKKDIILFMGFDYRYTGNSRYLFEQIIDKRKEDIFFVTSDEIFNNKYRIEPNSQEFYSIFYSAKIIIFESWIPDELIKTKNCIWIQLWHGTPLKKMLYDSEEKEIISIRPNHKIRKFNDIKRWDYLLTDNKNINKIFERAFLFPKERILPLGYPRVEYLIKNKNDISLKNEIKNKAKLPLDKKIVTYLPTWRDYNYGIDESEMDFEYILEEKTLKRYLGDEYKIVSKNHVFLNSCDITNVDIETQELLLISDYIITDYSSVMFDAFTIDLPVILLVKDCEKYMNSRGVYTNIWKHMIGMICKTEEEASNLIKNYKFDVEYEYLKNNLCYKNDTNKILCDIILEILDKQT